MTVKCSNKKAPIYIANREPFEASNLYGQIVDYASMNYYTGQLPERWALELKLLLDEVTPTSPMYVVRSFNTPIAWWSEKCGWVIPEVKYSVSTSKHQGHVRYALHGVEMFSG